jgi:AAA ATPase containing von Willebrand factor type A (vWA) domain
MDGYTFDEGIAFLRLCQAPEGVVMHIATTHNRSHLHSEIHKMLRMPGTMRLLQEKGFGREEVPPVQESNESAPKSNESVPKSNEIEPKSNDDEPDSDETDPTEIILTKEDVRTHENTRLEDMPNDLCRNLWQKRQDVYREMQQAHLKMRAVPEGEEHNEERAKWRAEVLRLDAENDKYWQQIDAEIERFNAEKERADEKADKEDQAGFNVSTYRAYICKAIRKKELSPVQFAELQHRVNAMLAAGVEMDPETIEKLKAKGITVD